MHQNGIKNYLTTPNSRKRAAEARDEAHNKNRKIEDDEMTGTNNMFQALSEIEAPTKNPTVRVPQSKMPPIIIGQELVNTKDTLAKIRKWAQNMFFKTIDGKPAVCTFNPEDYESVKSKLNEAGIKFYTFTPPTDKPKKLVLKGIDSMFTVEEIKEDLLTQTQQLINITQMKSMRKTDPKILNMYQVTFKSECNLGDVKRSIRYCCNYAVQWEDYRKPKSFLGTQCFRCQRYGHTAKNCGMDFRCLKCGNSHQIGDCPKLPAEKPKCANCCKEHPANYKGCEVFQTYKQSMNRKTSSNKGLPAATRPKLALRQSQIEIQNQNNVKRSSSSDQQHSYSNAARHATSAGARRNLPASSATTNTKQIENENHTNVYSSFNDEVSKLFNLSFMQVMSKINVFWADYTRINNEEEKKLVMLNFLLNFATIAK